MQNRVLSAATPLLLAAVLAACGDAGLAGPEAPEATPPTDAAGIAATPTVLGALAGDAAQNQLYAEIRQATAGYRQIERALEDGYVRGSGCVETPSGGMGFHYIRPGLIDGVVEPTRPEALVYAPLPNGRLRLVAVEHIVVAALWSGDEPPALGDQAFDDHTAPGSPGPPFPHYQLHSWVWLHNPAGMHTPYNPAVSCADAAAVAH